MADAPLNYWRCFHCDEVFTTSESAAEHFGTSEYQRPGCQIDIAEYRRMEETHRRHCEEDTDLHREIHAAASRGLENTRRAEESGYAKGLADAKKHPAELGLMPIAAAPSPPVAAVPATPVIWGIWNSHGFYDWQLDEASAKDWCAHFSKHEVDPLKTYTCAPLYTQPQPAQPLTGASWQDGINAAADMLAMKAEHFAADHAYNDMGAISFGRGSHAEAKHDYYTSLLELESDVRAMLTAPSTPTLPPGEKS